MRAVCCGIFLLFSFFFPSYQSICFNDVVMSCTPQHILMTNISATRHIAKQLMLQCNARQTCKMKLANNECVEYRSYCLSESEIQNKMEITEASETQLQALDMVNVMSEKYQQGHEMEAKSIQCELKFSDTSLRSLRSLRTMRLTINDFASFAKSDGLCLQVGNTKKEPFCSGSQKLYIPYGLFKSSTGFQFSINRNGDTANLTKVRFWFLLDVSPNDVIFQLKCVSKEVTKTLEITSLTFYGTTEANVTTDTNRIYIIVLSMLSIALAAIAFVAGLFCRTKRACKTRLSANIQQQSYFMEADSPYYEIGNRDDMDISSVTFAENIIYTSSQQVPGFSIQNRKLPSPPRQSIMSVDDTDDEYLPPSKNHEETPREDQDSSLNAEMNHGVKSTQGEEESQNHPDETAEDNVYNHLDQQTLILPEERYKPIIYVPLPLLSEENAVEIIEDPGEIVENAEDKRKDESVTNDNARSSDEDDPYYLELKADDAGT